MGFDKTSRLRDLLASLPPGVITPTQRLTLQTINSYTDDAKSNGACWVGHERLAKEIGVKTRALMKILHELGDGEILEKDRRRTCNRPCKRHLGLIKRHVKKVRVGVRQNYSIRWQALEGLSSMYQSTHLQLDRMYSGNLEGELEWQGVSTPVHTYKHNKQNKNLINDSVISEFLRLIPKDKQEKLGDLRRIDELISEYRARGGLSSHLIELVNETSWDQIRSPRHYLINRLEREIESFERTW